MTKPPVRSAKDAINAMYASDPSKRLSTYLAKTSSNMHHANSRDRRPLAQPPVVSKPTAPKPASAPKSAASPANMLRRAPASPAKPAPAQSKSTSVPIHLSPKKAPRVTAPRTAPVTALRPAKQKIALDRTAAAVSAIKKAASAALPQKQPAVSPLPPKPGTKPAAPKRTGMMQDVVRPKRPVKSTSVSEFGDSADPIRARKRPADSVKQRFRPAPKGYAATTSEQAEKTRPYRVSAYEMPTFHATPEPPVDSAIHIYGLSPEPTADADWVTPNERRAASEAGLGVVEDYHHPTAATSEPLAPETSVIVGRHPAASDSNRYALSAQSPYFRKSAATFEKRPLSHDSAPVKPASKPAPEPPKSPKPKSIKSTFTLAKSPEPPATHLEPKPAKNVYEKKPAKTPKKPTKDRPVMIIPASRRSHAPLLLLLLITVLLGAAVGALAYLFFFQ